MRFFLIILFSLIPFSSAVALERECTFPTRVSIITDNNQKTAIKTISPLGNSKIWPLEKDFKFNADGDLENDFLLVSLSKGQILAVTVKKLPATFDCTKY